MSKDKFQDKYDEIFQGIKEDKMEWDFEDFLKKAEAGDAEKNETPIIPLETKSKPSFPKWFWMAASVVLLFGIGFIFNYNQKSDVEDQAQFVENQIKNQKKDFIEENNDHQEQVAVNHVNDTISEVKKDSIFQENQMAEKDVLDEILPKRGRLKKESRPRFVSNSSKYNKAKNDSTGYKDSYVIVNGKRIENVEEAINVTKYSFQVFANVSEKLAQPKVMDNVD
jgi:cell division protein FtsL